MVSARENDIVDLLGLPKGIHMLALMASLLDPGMKGGAQLGIMYVMLQCHSVLYVIHFQWVEKHQPK